MWSKNKEDKNFVLKQIVMINEKWTFYIRKNSRDHKARKNVSGIIQEKKHNILWLGFFV